MTNSNISKFSRLVMGVAAAAMIAASCGTDEPDVEELVEPVPVETTTAPTTAPVYSEDTAPTVEQDEAPSTTTTVAEPEPAQIVPSLTVEPVTVSEGLNTFTIEGSGFDPSLTIWTLLCPLASEVSEGTPEDELTAAMGSVTAADCDLTTSQEAPVDDEGSFTTEREAIVIDNFMWVASDSDQTQVAAAAVFMEASEPEPEPTPTSVPVAVDDPSLADRALAFLAGELGVPEGEVTLTGTEAVTWADTSLGCPQEGYAHAQVLTPGYRFTFSHGTASHDVHSDEQGTHFVRPMGCYEPEPAEPEPSVTTSTSVPVSEPPEDEDPEPTVTTTPPTVTSVPEEDIEPVPVVVARVSEPLTRCASETGWYGATRMSVLTGTTVDGWYTAVVTGGEDSCEQIKSAWDTITQAEAQRITEGQYPCEYTAAYNYWPIQNQTNGPALLVGCWPRLLEPGDLGVEQISPDPGHEAVRLWNREGFWILPPNHPAMVAALYDCYRDTLEGPPPGWVSPGGGEWPTILLCHSMLNDHGNPVRSLGVTPECAAQQMRAQLEERKDRGWVGENQYTGDFSWVNCSTNASRLIPEGLTTYTQRCEAVVDASAGPSTDLLAEAVDATREQVIAAVKAMFCEGTKQAIRDNSPAFDVFLSNWNEPFGEFVAVWLPPEASICYEAASLVAAQRAVDGGGWIRVKFC